MLTIKLTIKDKAIDNAIDEVEEHYGVLLTRRYFTSFLKKHPKLAVGISEEDFDTVCREEFAEYLANELTGLPWPLYGDGLKFKKKFQIAFRKAVEKTRSIRLEEDWTCGPE